MAGQIQRKAPDPYLQAVILRRDLNWRSGQMFAYASEAAIAFIAAHACAGRPLSLTPEEIEWLCGR